MFWLRAMDPEVAVWQAGGNNRYGHPHGETLEALGELGVQVLGTSEHGHIAILSKDDEIIKICLSDYSVFHK